MTVLTKACIACERLLPIDDFPSAARARHRRFCRPCWNERTRINQWSRRRREHPELFAKDDERARMPEVSMTDAAYWAAFFDGEGSVGIKRSGARGQLVVQFSNLDTATMVEMHEKFGGHPYHVLRPKSGRPIWHYVPSGLPAPKFLRVLLPYLRQKRPQAEVALT